MRNFKKAIALVATTVATAALLPIGQAHALVTPAMNLSITPYSTYHRICASGTAPDPLQAVSHWELAIDGTRTVGAPISQGGSATYYTFSACQNVSKLGAVQGEYHVAFVFSGAGTDVYGKRTGYGSWQPALGDLVGTLQG